VKYSQFEDLPVWKAAVEFALKVFEFTNRADFRGLGDTKNQLERAALSISNNIAEGFERGTTADLIYFLYIGRGSAGETRSILRICEGLARISNLRSEILNLINRGIGISKQLHGWIDSLKNSEIKGVKFYTNKEKRRIEQDKEFEEFDKEMDRYRKELLERLLQREADAASAEK
jgi:four helix bundle protein